MKISLIAATDLENGIGKNNQLLCHLPADLRRFKQLTTGHSIVMGRKTFESLPNGPLPNRKNIVLTRDQTFYHEGILIAHTLEKVFEPGKSDEKIFVIGGGQIYELFLPYADFLHITKIKHHFSADTFFPAIDPQKWQIESILDIKADEKNQYDFSFIDYVKK